MFISFSKNSQSSLSIPPGHADYGSKNDNSGGRHENE